MMTKTINLKIKSKDSFGEVLEENVIGIKTVIQKKNYYEYQSQLGFCKIMVDEKEIRMERDGEAKIKFFFMKNGIGEFKYQTSHFEKEFQIKEGKFQVAPQKLNFFYEICEGDFQVNSIEIEIEEK